MTKAFSNSLWLEIQDEFVRAQEKHTFERTPANYALPTVDKLSILVEEVGEVAKALTYDNGNTEDLYKELIQTATMAAAWAASIEGWLND